MGIKKRNKVSAEFSMSSLTDIIFLLLIFFMLTSSLVAPNSLNLKLPGSPNRKQPPSSTKIDEVKVSNSGKYYFNRKRISIDDLERTLARAANRSRKQLNITIAPDQDAPIENVVAVMDIAMRYKINGILAAEK